ncbi:uroporphyrinogen-III C-methyltransferase [soil metagenome]
MSSTPSPEAAPVNPVNGSVTFIGAGPGAADLMTVRGTEKLRQAQVVLYDALTDPALRNVAPEALWIHVGKRGFADSTGQPAINELLVTHALRGEIVVRLKGGDPSVFGRLEEELQALADAGIACEVVPGVTAALAAAADTHRPLTRRGTGRSVSFSTAFTNAGSTVATRTADTEVFYMAGKQLAGLSHRLAEAGWPDDAPVSVVSRAGWPDRLLTEHTAASVAEAADLHAGRPTIVTVGAGAAPVSGTSSTDSPVAPSVHLLQDPTSAGHATARGKPSSS